MEFGLKGKTVIVTGGGSNIGRAIFLAFMKEGCNTVNAEIDEAQAKKVLDEAKSLPGKGLFVKTDVTDWNSVQNTVKTVIEKTGQVDVLVNNVGWVYDRLFVEKPREEWEKEIKLNYWSFVNCTRGVLDHFIARKGGAVVSVASDAGRIGEFREAVYGGCKGAVISTTKAIAREVGRYNIRLNTVCPGATIPKKEEVGKDSMWQEAFKFFTPEMAEKATHAYPLRRLGTAPELANAVVFLASDAASFITGQTLSVSGGYSMM
ncbi:MAG: SDR family oxidoreductase [Chloroflexi bacterium]|nr:SDR family oxidoreductase [Chloroflexota bacterium]